MRPQTYSANRHTIYAFGINITLREILASVTIISFMLLAGFLISDKINNSIQDKNEEYQKAVKLNTSQEFQYGLRTDVGNAFCYGELSAVDTVSYPEIDGEYMYISKTREEYRMHTREVTKTRTGPDGKTETYTETEIYYSWDTISSERLHSDELTFNDVVFPYSKFDVPLSHYITTIYKWSDVRYVYYGTDTDFTGTLYTKISDHTIADQSRFFQGKTPDETLESLISSSGAALIFFWLFWIALIAGIIFYFCSRENAWLE